MLQNLLVKILENQLKIDNVTIVKIADFLSKYKKSSYIYPSVIKSKFNLDNKTTYDILNSLEKEKILKIYYEVVCYRCNKILQHVERFSEIESNTICEDCDVSMETLDNVKIIYKVIE